MLNGGELHQVSHMAVKVPLGWILWLWQHLKKDCSCCDVLPCTELLRELHAGIVDDVVVDPACALTRRTHGVYPF